VCKGGRRGISPHARVGVGRVAAYNQFRAQKDCSEEWGRIEEALDALFPNVDLGGRKYAPSLRLPSLSLYSAITLTWRDVASGGRWVVGGAAMTYCGYRPSRRRRRRTSPPHP
jgi:hypothetical protein